MRRERSRSVRILLRAAGLLAIYLFVLSSARPGDVLVGGVLALALAVALRPRRGSPRRAPIPVRVYAFVVVVLQTAVEVARGSWQVMRCCLGAPARPQFVEIPRQDRSRHSVALWGVLTSEAPDEVVVDVDDARGVLIVHVIGGVDPDRLREQHEVAYERWQQKVVR